MGIENFQKACAEHLQNHALDSQHQHADYCHCGAFSYLWAFKCVASFRATEWNVTQFTVRYRYCGGHPIYPLAPGAQVWANPSLVFEPPMEVYVHPYIDPDCRRNDLDKDGKWVYAHLRWRRFLAHAHKYAPQWCWRKHTELQDFGPAHKSHSRSRIGCWQMGTCGKCSRPGTHSNVWDNHQLQTRIPIGRWW